MAITKSGFIKPVRITITVPYRVFEMLEDRSMYEGRSMSNLAAVSLEQLLSKGRVTA
jgi:hypothetical protein